MHYTDQKRYAIDCQSLEYTPYSCVFDIDGELFTERESTEVKDVECKAYIEANRTGSTVNVDVRIEGTATVECDRCLEDCKIDVEYEGSLVVHISDQEGEYDGEQMWVAKGDNIPLDQYLYESIIIALPYQRHHAEGECNPDMLARFTQAEE